MHKEYMEEIIDAGNKESMEKLGYVFNKAMEHLCECDYEMYKKLEMKLYEAVYGKKLNEEMAEKIITDMKPYHMKWSLEQTKEVQEEYGMTDIRDIDFWVVMNSAYNDFSNLFDDNIEMYVKYTKDFIKDEDAKEGKVFTYFTKIPK